MSDKDLNKMRNKVLDISHNYYESLINLENVNGVGFGEKIINGVKTLEPCIHVLVNNKVSKKYLSNNNIIPKTFMGIKTDVIEIGKVKINSNPVFPIRKRPLESGVVIGLMGKIPSGTMCCIVSKEKEIESDESDDEETEDNNIVTLEYFMLSNNHVIANLNDASIGSLIIQPSKFYNGIFPKDLVGVLETFIPIKFIKDNSKPINYMDCAIARITNKNFISNKILDSDKINGLDTAKLNVNVKKIGFYSGLTRGKVSTLDTTITVEFDKKKEALFKNQITTEIETSPGDSGSAILTDENKIIGMHMAGTGKGYSIGNNINEILKELKVDLYTG